MSRNHTMLPGENSADFCRRMGWTVGTRLVGNEGCGDTIIEITAIGDRGVLARDTNCPRVELRYEGPWSLAWRDWIRVPDEHYWGA